MISFRAAQDRSGCSTVVRIFRNSSSLKVVQIANVSKVNVCRVCECVWLGGRLWGSGWMGLMRKEGKTGCFSSRFPTAVVCVGMKRLF